ncbi:HCO3 transporter family-domain-containing protein [Aspergillus heterothallicus]
MSLISAFRPRSTRVSSASPRSEPRQRRGPKPSAAHGIDPDTERDDTHSIITPSKHTPRAFRALKETQDILNLRRRYASDWTIFNQLVFASAVYVFFTNLLPGITFASDLYVLTGKSYGAIEVVFSTGLCGIIFSLFSIQPLTILGVTGPFAVLAENLYELCRNDFDIPFLPFMAWSLTHAAWLHYLLSIANAHGWTMRYVTTFTTEIFSLLNSIIYFQKAIQELERAHEVLSFAAFLYAIIGATGTMLLAIFLSTAENWKPVFHRYIRRSKMPLQWGFAAIIPGIIITVLFFFDHEAPLHSESLMHPETKQRVIVVDGEEKIDTYEMKCVYEQRWSALLHAGAILCFVSPPFMKFLGLTPTSVLAGLFMFMGEQSLAVNPIVYRTFYLLTPPSELPPLPSTLANKNSNRASFPVESSQNPSYIPVHIYTVLQIVITIVIFIVTLTRAAPAFPILIVALVPFRLSMMKRWWPREVLRFVDAWACKEGTPEDDEDLQALHNEADSESTHSSRAALSVSNAQEHRGLQAAARGLHVDQTRIPSGGEDPSQDWVELDHFRSHVDEELGRIPER